MLKKEPLRYLTEMMKEVNQNFDMFEKRQDKTKETSENGVTSALTMSMTGPVSNASPRAASLDMNDVPEDAFESPRLHSEMAGHHHTKEWKPAQTVLLAQDSVKKVLEERLQIHP